MSVWKRLFGGKESPSRGLAEPNDVVVSPSTEPSLRQQKGKQTVNWKCPSCGALLEKSSILLQRLSENPDVPVGGTLECPKCGVRHRSAEIYAGKFDL
jgi:predicted RNA-binding Zn-ribbon protein involved in translation (DUF1610 family)